MAARCEPFFVTNSFVIFFQRRRGREGKIQRNAGDAVEILYFFLVRIVSVWESEIENSFHHFFTTFLLGTSFPFTKKKNIGACWEPKIRSTRKKKVKSVEFSPNLTMSSDVLYKMCHKMLQLHADSR